ncbi:MAG: D-TA family PLP-dependent enzyme [Candidatus Sumerlaeaceae bacterium]
MLDEDQPWYVLRNVSEIPSPALIVFPDRIEENLRRMIAITGGTDRLRPHIKTHKMPEIIRMKLALGITRFKAATIAEAEMAAQCGAPDVLYAYQPVGPNIARFLELMRRFPDTRFCGLADDENAIKAISTAASDVGVVVKLMLDLDCGQHRSGVEPGEHALQLVRMLAQSPALKAAGLHAYDGHIHHTDLAARTAECEAAFLPVQKLRETLQAAGLHVPTIVAGGTPTFAIHAARNDVECSPGTCVLWDHSYGSTLPDLDFLHAAVVLTRVVSKPASNRLCLDLGHKAIASENPHPRVYFPALPDARFVGHSEEHMVLETPRAGEFRVGDAFYGIPWHICPTVALHSEAVVIRDGSATETWKVTARDRRISI